VAHQGGRQAAEARYGNDNLVKLIGWAKIDDKNHDAYCSAKTAGARASVEDDDLPNGAKSASLDPRHAWANRSAFEHRCWRRRDTERACIGRSSTHRGDQVTRSMMAANGGEDDRTRANIEGANRAWRAWLSILRREASRFETFSQGRDGSVMRWIESMEQATKRRWRGATMKKRHGLRWRSVRAAVRG
jgi:hypothetical protein